MPPRTASNSLWRVLVDKLWRSERADLNRFGGSQAACRSLEAGVSLIFPDLGHYIELDQPDAVIAAIGTVLRQVKPTSKGASF